MRWQECFRCRKVYPEYENRHTCPSCRERKERTRRVLGIVITVVYVAVVVAVFTGVVLWWASIR